MTIIEQSEGIVKYISNHKNSELNSSDFKQAYLQLEGWRKILHKLELIGGGNKRLYDGYGYGNISVRSKIDKSNFLISGTQTGHKNNLNLADYALVQKVSVEKNSSWSKGLTAPSSEALSHGSLYLASKNIQSVIHIHHAGIWGKANELNLEQTPASAAYGTVNLALALQEVFNKMNKQKNRKAESGVISMKGHADGIIIFGSSIADAAVETINLLASYNSL